MPPVIKQTQSIILPDVSAQPYILQTETEIIDDLVEHTSAEFPTEYLQEKTVHIYAQEVALAAVVPGNLQCWIELSPYPSANNAYWPFPNPTSTAYWAAINGGGGVIPPTVPHIEVSGLAGAAGTLVHPILLNWTSHSPFARLVVQTPIAANLPNAFWILQAIITAKTP